MSSDGQQYTPSNPPTFHEAYQDWLIAQRLPDWLRTASVQHLRALGEAMSLSLYFNERVRGVLGRVTDIADFARPRLQLAMDQAFGSGHDVTTLRLRWGHREPVVTSQPIGYPVTVPVYTEVPLLEAALRNFTEAEGQANGQLVGNRLVAPKPSSDEQGESDQPAARALPSATQFAAVCRKLDLGGAYQKHLASVLRATGHADGDESGAEPTVSSLFARGHRYAMLADAHVALIKGEVDADEHALLVALCGLHTSLKLHGHRVEVKQLDLLGCHLEQILVLDARDETYSPLHSASHRVLVHIPGDPQAPWRAYPDLRHFANALGKRLRTAEYQRFFARFVRRRSSQAFFTAVVEGYDGVTDLANINLQERLRECPTPWFDTLGTARIRQIEDDAAMIAVPVAQLDRAVQHAHDQRLLAEGWALINLAGFFIPGVGLALLAYTAWQLLDEVFQGIQAWHDGYGAEALEHLVNVAIDVATVAATGAAVGVARAAWLRSSWVDSMVPTQLDDGVRKLWQPDLSPFRVAAPPTEAIRDEAGVYRAGDQAWVEMDGHHYAVEQRAVDGQWQLRAQAGHAPGLCHNGAGAWRLWSDHPGDWEQVPRMFRRLGGAFAEVDDRQVDLLLFIHDLDADRLRALHVHGEAPTAELLDSVSRFLIDKRIGQLIEALHHGGVSTDRQAMQQLLAMSDGVLRSDQALAELAELRREALFQALYVAQQQDDEASVATLRRMFPSLHARAARALLQAATPGERQAVVEQGRVPLRLAQASRESVRGIRLIRGLEGLYLDAPQNADLARITLSLLEDLPGAPVSIRWRLMEASRQGPLLLSVGSPDAQRVLELVHNNGAFLLMEQQRVVAGPGELFEVLVTAFDHHQRQSIGLAHPAAASLRALLGGMAGQRRARLASLFESGRTDSWFNAPQRLADGRLGYPLSGRGGLRDRPRALYALVRALYPTFDDHQVENWLARVSQAGRNVETELARLGAELEALDGYLQAWSRLASNRRQRADRRELAAGLRACWQRRAIRANVDLPDAYRLTIRHLELNGLPDLPDQINFSHVRELSLMSVGISDVPAGFLRAFPAVRTLELASNGLTRIPSALTRLPALRELDLFDNQIVMDALQSRTLARLHQLEYINLSHNPLGQAFSVSGMPRLRRLHLRATGIEELPMGLLTRLDLTVADLRDNRIRRLPQRFFLAPAWVSASIRLDGNLLSESDQQRLSVFMQYHGWSADIQAENIDQSSARQHWLDAADTLQRTLYSSMWDELEVYDGSQDFFRALTRLLQTADFQQRPVVLAGRVFAMLRTMCEHESLRLELFAQASLPVTCQDSAALAFSGLELRMLVWQARTAVGGDGEEAALLRLGRQLWRLDEVDRIAQRDYEARRAGGADPDQIEVVLAYRVGLREVLDLPAQPTDMLFAEVAGLDQEHIDHARDEVLVLETPERLSQALVDRDFWQEYLVRANGDRFESVDAAFHARVDALMTAAPTMPEGDYLSEMNRVGTERDVARRALMLRLTRQVIGDLPGPSTS